CLQGIKYPYSF
nr:immunoglobulin light chain junction region [Macaca mulatta]MOW41384.1 immunoglobulin light chain junction region [Macaca mulatta]MOW41402.1 immunoglobulin light chain junction region [Macaca mulatta]MOW42829.1 immunoglobulin light chain junction region [Macaca mulatta]MOW43326.1 immunoglobulin light chain junction region [Macaca mulatta]